ncbi:MAG TPA: DUF444 family protein [Spirochaetia bacterium]|nr:DUF444 family protein [Spirochaetia bacterium]
MNTVEPKTDIYDIQQKGNRDQERHLEKIKGAIKDNLKELVANENIISSDGQKKVVVPIKYLDEYRFRYDPKGLGKEGAGQGRGKSAKGDVIGRRPAGGDGAPGEEHRDFQYLVEIDVEQLAEYLFEALSLPNLDPAKKSVIVDQEYTDRRKKGALANLDKRATLKEVIKRRAAGADPVLIANADLRFRTWQEKEKEVSNAVILLMRDISGSMGEEERFLTRAVCFWITLFLRRRYDRADIVFINYDTEAFEVDEDRFFHEGMGGGTRCVSAFELVRTIIGQRYPPDMWNIYGLQFSDGEDFDCTGAAGFLETILPWFQMFGYVEIEPEGTRHIWSSKLSAVYGERELFRRYGRAARITDSRNVWEAIKILMGGEVNMA